MGSVLRDDTSSPERDACPPGMNFEDKTAGAVYCLSKPMGELLTCWAFVLRKSLRFSLAFARAQLLRFLIIPSDL